MGQTHGVVAAGRPASGLRRPPRDRHGLGRASVYQMRDDAAHRHVGDREALQTHERPEPGWRHRFTAVPRLAAAMSGLLAASRVTSAASILICRGRPETCMEDLVGSCLSNPRFEDRSPRANGLVSTGTRTQLRG